MKPQQVCVLGGGTSSESAVSQRSAQAVSAALRQAGYKVQETDPAGLDEAALLAAVKGCDIVFPVLHGAGGEDGTVQAVLEKHAVPFVGASAAVSAVCFDKARYKQEVAGLGISVPAGELVTRTSIWQSPLVHGPYVLKPYNGGSSVDTFIVRDLSAADTHAIEDALDTYGSMLLEELVEGREITVGVVGGTALPVIEIIPPSDGEFDYENKYNGRSQELCPPQHISEDIQAAAAKIAEQIHVALAIDDFSRTDIMVRASDDALIVLETNTIPGMTDQSLLPKAAAVAGHTMPELCSLLVDAAYARRRTQ